MKTSMAILSAAASLSISASGVVLYDNPYTSATGNIYNRTSDGAAILNHHTLTKVVVPASGWSIDKVTTYNQHNYDFDVFADGGLPTVLDGAQFHVVPEADLATYDPTSAALLPGTITQINPGSFRGPGFNMTEVDLASTVVLSAGTYWIGLVPKVDDPSFQAGIQFGKTLTDGASEIAQFAETGALTGTTVSPSAEGVWETTSGKSLAIKLEGVAVPEPSGVILLGVGAFGFLLRRRR
jgi:hypothetical protein